MPNYESEFDDHDIVDLEPIVPPHQWMWPENDTAPTNYAMTEVQSCRDAWHHWMTTGREIDSHPSVPMRGSEIYRDFFTGITGEQLMHHIGVLAGHLVDKQQQICELRTKLREFQARSNDLVTTSIAAVEENAGCLDGKEAVLEAKGIVWRPSRRYRVSFDIEMRPAERDDLERLLDQVIENGGLTQAIVDRFLGTTAEITDYERTTWDDD